MDQRNDHHWSNEINFVREKEKKEKKKPIRKKNEYTFEYKTNAINISLKNSMVVGKFQIYMAVDKIEREDRTKPKLFQPIKCILFSVNQFKIDSIIFYFYCEYTMIRLFYAIIMCCCNIICLSKLFRSCFFYFLIFYFRACDG